MSGIPDGVEIRGQRFVVVDWPAYIAWHKANGTYQIPKVSVTKGAG